MAEPTTSLTAFERQVFGGAHEAAVATLMRMLGQIERGADLPETEAEPGPYFTRFAAAIATLLTADAEPFPSAAVDRLAFHNRHLTAIFRLSGYADPGRLHAIVQGALPGQRDAATAARILATASVAAAPDIDWRGLLERHVDVASSAFLALFSHRAPISADAERKRLEALEHAPLLAAHVLRRSQLPLLCQAWMFCSYLTAPDRHALKAVLNGLVADWLAREGIVPAPLPPTRPLVERPVLAVVADVLMSWHAMFKTYANFLKQLGNRFHMVLVALEGRVDDPTRALFDEVREVPDTRDAIRDAVARIEETAPALIYYPSVGMSVLTVQLCNLRLAPIQVASVGHPATTKSPEIDYMAMGHSYYGEAAQYSERVLLLQSTGALFEPTLDAEPPSPQVREAPDPLRIAVSSSALKLNAGFLDVCRDVAAEAGRAVEFHFFPNEEGIRHRDCAYRIRAALPDAVVHRRTGYDDYLRLLNGCDLRFGTFPFGGANTTMDAYLLGIPTLTLVGPEPHSRTDGRFVTLFGLPCWLAAPDIDAYRAAALRLVRDDAVRIDVSRRILDAGPAKVLFEREQSAYPTDFADTLWWVYRHHDAVRESDRKAWSWEDRVAFDEGKR